MSISMLALFCIAGIDSGDGLLALLRQSQKDLKNVRFAYEGEIDRLDELGQPKSARVPLSGTVAVDFVKGAVRWDEKFPDSTGVHRYLHYASRGESIEQDVGPGQEKFPIETKRRGGGFGALHSEGGEPLAHQWPTAALALLDSADLPRLEDLGSTVVEGRTCRKLVFNWGGKLKYQTTYLVDLERNGCFLGGAKTYGGVEIARFANVDVREVVGKDQKRIWLPMSTIVEQAANYRRATKDWVKANSPWRRSAFRIVASTLVVNEPAIEVKRPPPSRLPSRTASIQFSKLPNAPPRPRPTQLDKSVFESGISEADIEFAKQKAVLRTAPTNWTQITAFLCGVAILSIAAALILEQRRSAA